MIDVRGVLSEFRSLLSWIEARMLLLQTTFNQEVPHGRLRLRPYRRSKDGPPYAVYWILISRRRLDGVTGIRRKPRYPFRRVPVNSRQDLDDALYHGAISSRREVVYRTHARLAALNDAHASISGAVEAIRRNLQGFLPQAPTRDPLRRAEAYLTAFEDALDDARSELQAIDAEMRILADYLPLRLVFEVDAEHPYGRLRWRWTRDGRPELPLTDRRKRELRLPRELWRDFTPFEGRRRRAAARLARLTRIARRVKTRVLPVPARVRDLLGLDSPPVYRRTSA